MINYLWGFMIICGMGFGIVTGNGKELALATIESSKEAVNLCVTMLGVMGLWMGFMQIAIKSGIIAKLTNLINPIIKILFPTLPSDNKAREYITSNFVANILGLGWAATPVGLKAMSELRKLNNNSEEASIDMCTFLIINISSLQLIPINIIAYRSQYGSKDPSWIIGYAIVATTVSTLAGVLFAILGRKIKKNVG